MSTEMSNTGHLLADILSPDFSPSKLTKPQLRSLLLEFGNIPMDDFPAPSAKKEILLEIFEERVIKRAPELLKKTQPSSSGIISIGADGKESHLSTNFSNENPFQSPVKSPSRGRPTEKTSPKEIPTTKKGVSQGPSTRKRTPSAVGKTTRKRSATPSSSRKRSVTPVQSNVDTIGRKRRSSSVVIEVSESEQMKSPLFKAKPARVTNFKERESSSPRRRKSTSTSPAKAKPPIANEPKSSPSILKRDKKSTIISPTYSFMIPPGSLPSITSSKSPKNSKSKRSFFFFFMTMMILVLLCIFFIGLGSFMSFYAELPFCPIERIFEHSSYGTIPATSANWLDLALIPIYATISKYFSIGIPHPSLCWPCPMQATCSSSTSWTCAPGYAPSRTWITQRPLCVIDMQQQGAVDALVIAIENLLGRVLGEHLCSGGDFDSAPFISSKMLSDRFGALEGPWSPQPTNGTTSSPSSSFITAHRFEAFLAAALAKIAGRTDSFDVRVEPHHKGSGVETWFRAKAPIYSLRCHLVRFCLRHRLTLFILFVFIVAIAWIRSWLTRRQSLIIDSKTMVETVLDKLVQQEYLNRQDAVAFPSCIPVSQLRDALLGELGCSHSYGRLLWKEVIRLIHANSNVRESTTLIRGEQHRVWEWIGPEVLKSTSSGEISLLRRSFSSPIR